MIISQKVILKKYIFLNHPGHRLFLKKEQKLADYILIDLKPNIIGRNNLQNNLLIQKSYSIISVTTPAPTVLPPSRIANLSSSSIAIGVINSPLISILSPGITMSTPSGN